MKEFRLQLSLLLWKNFRLKRRTPVRLRRVSLFNVIHRCHLSLFSLWYCWSWWFHWFYSSFCWAFVNDSQLKRSHQVSDKRLIGDLRLTFTIFWGFFNARPLPSAGVISVMEAFCDGGVPDSSGFLTFPNASYVSDNLMTRFLVLGYSMDFRTKDFLWKFHRVVSSHHFFQSEFASNSLRELPDVYRSVVEEPVEIHHSLIRNSERKPYNCIFGWLQQLPSNCRCDSGRYP